MFRSDQIHRGGPTGAAITHHFLDMLKLSEGPFLDIIAAGNDSEMLAPRSPPPSKSLPRPTAER